MGATRAAIDMVLSFDAMLDAFAWLEVPGLNQPGQSGPLGAAAPVQIRRTSGSG